MKQNRNLWPLGIILTFVLFISGTIGLVVMACAQRTDLVSPDYYEQELKFQDHKESLERAQRLGASVAYEATTRSIRITLPKEQADRPIAGAIHFYRPSSAGLDKEVRFNPRPDGSQSVDGSRLQPGLWKVRVNWTIADQEYCLDRGIIVGSPTP